MKRWTFERQSELGCSADAAFAWHERAGALARLTPPWQNVRIRERQGGIADGDRTLLELKLGPLRVPWLAEHRGYERGLEFRDVQIEGPFAHWEHRHRFEPLGKARCRLEDRIEFALPGGKLGGLAVGLVRRELERAFAYRHRVTAADLESHASYRKENVMKVLISGASGFVGSKLSPFLSAGGHHVQPLVRGKAETGQVAWEPEQGSIDADALEGLDAVIHLAGENIAGARWSEPQKRRIRESRVKGTRLLSQALAGLRRKPGVLVSASAIGYYGSRGAELLDETSVPGADFLAEVCEAWERSTQPAAEAGIRVVNLRFGVILSPDGGALAKMLTPFRLGVGGRIGSGEQYMSWIAVDDVLGAIQHAAVTATLHGPVNVVAPSPVTNRSFTRTLGRVLGRPTFFPLPAFAARLALGEMANALLLASQRVEPKKLLGSGYRFRFAKLEAALRHVLGR